MENNFRIKTDIANDHVVRTKLTQDIDFLEILSLKIKQSDTYRLHVSNYGVIVGRILANDAFGIPNAKVSVFIPLDDADKLDSTITSLYPYATIQTKDRDNRRYNLLPNDSNDICYRTVGTFPTKRFVLDNEAEIEVFEKYWKYTTTTNKSGDYMIFGVPTGTHQVHVDIDLSDIGVLSQKPRDFIYKGYNISQFDNANQFKESTNLDNLSQLLTQNSAVHVYPFWGDNNVEEIAITRCDLQVQYKFEPTCVFFGAIVSDNYSNNIGDKCNPSKYAGFNRHLVAGEGTIEMIRKTPDGLVEEFQIQGNRLIDSNGVWCYQIPMNLDYVGTDEYGNVVPTDNPKKGIPTRTSVRFRVSMQETSSEGVSRHRAKYLIPNVQIPIKDKTDVYINEPNKYLQCYEFGSATPDEYFRDLYWNKVYSVKNYIPRIQNAKAKNTQLYSAIRTVNSSGNLNPFPFNHARFRLAFGYRVLCLLMDVVLTIICGLNSFVTFLPSRRVIGRLFSWICKIMPCVGLSGLSEDDSTPVEYFPCCDASRGAKKCMKCEEPGCIFDTRKGAAVNTVQQSLSQEYDTVNLDFYNDWVNGCLYLPIWFWKKTKKRKFLFGLFSKKAVNRYCNCDSNYSKLHITENCSLHTDNNYNVTDGDGGNRYHYQFPDNRINIGHGIVKEVENRDGLKIYYYAPGVPRTNDYRDTTDPTALYVRLYATDIILLGSLNDCDLDNLPRPYISLPSTTANVPYIATLTSDATDNEFEEIGTTNDNSGVEITGMDWLGKDSINKGLFMDLSCTYVGTKPKTCVNLARLSELGVTLDSRYFDAISNDGVLKYDNERPADGMITRYELVDNEVRAMFASLNHNGLTEKVYNPNTGYNTYKLLYNYPVDFDGHLSKYSLNYTNSFKIKTYDVKDKSYIDFRFGILSDEHQRHFYSNNGANHQLPLFNNSFYFYFGLNEGNTAIDKFNNLFYSQCFKNTKFPFSMTYVTTPAKWCKLHDNYNNKLEYNKINDYLDELETDYATITISLKGIKTPYSYKLFDAFNTELISETDIYSYVLKFGYDTENGAYSDKKNGALRYLNSDEYYKYVVNNSNYAYLLDNDEYFIEITDGDGKTLRQPITISQSSLSLSASVVNLGDKYYDGTTIESDLCNDFNNYGEIVIGKVNIDGIDYTVTNFETIDIGVYKLNCENKEFVQLTIEPNFNSTEDDGVKFNECICNNSPYEPTIEKNKGLVFKVWVPGDYKLTANQYCNGKLNDNIDSEVVTVANGSPFLTYINETPMRFVLGKNTEPNEYNSLFYPKTNSDVTNIDSNCISGWFKTHDESAYKFPSLTSLENLEVWRDYIDVDTITDENGNNEDVSLGSKLDIVSFKFKCLMDMANMAYVDGTDEKTITYTSNGGKNPILYRGAYPDYSKFSSDSTTTEVVNDFRFDSDASVACLPTTSNIIGFNYTVYNQGDYWYRPNTEKKLFNNVFNDSSHLGNYFAAFTANAGFILNTNTDSWEHSNNVKFSSAPYKANPNVNVSPGDYTDLFNGFNDVAFVHSYPSDKSSNPYFRVLTIDRRIDYCYIIMMPFNNLDSFKWSDNDDLNWCNGRVIGYQYNGIEMAYDSKRNMVSAINDSQVNSGLYEYYLPKLYTDSEQDYKNNKWINGNEGLSKIIYNNSAINKKLYECSIKSGKTYDIRDKFWSTNKHIDPTDVNGLMYNQYPNGMPTVNGDFSKENYPLIRGLDVTGFPYSSRFTYSAINCKYANNLYINDNGGTTYKYECEVEEGDETTFSIGGNNLITLLNDDLATCASNSVGNVTYELFNNSFTPSYINISFKTPSDTANETHRYLTYLPFCLSFKRSDGNPFDDMKKILITDAGFNNFIARMDSLLSQGSCKYAQVPSGDYQLTQAPIDGDVFGLTNNRFVDGNNVIMYDDDPRIKGVVYTINDSILLDTVLGRKTPDVSVICYYRRYLNNEGDNLSKDILTFNIGQVINLESFSMTCEATIDDSMSGSGSTTMPSEGENPPQSGSTEVTIQRQVTTFKLIYDNVTLDAEKMSAALKYNGNVVSDATITTEGDAIIIRIIWGGSLSGTLLDATANPAELYVRMPNGLINKINFKLSVNGISS